MLYSKACNQNINLYSSRVENKKEKNIQTRGEPKVEKQGPMKEI